MILKPRVVYETDQQLARWSTLAADASVRGQCPACLGHFITRAGVKGPLPCPSCGVMIAMYLCLPDVSTLLVKGNVVVGVVHLN